MKKTILTHTRIILFLALFLAGNVQAKGQEIYAKQYDTLLLRNKVIFYDLLQNFINEPKVEGFRSYVGGKNIYDFTEFRILIDSCKIGTESVGIDDNYLEFKIGDLLIT